MVRCVLTPIQLHNGLVLSKCANCSAIMPNFKTTPKQQHLVIFKTKRCLSAKSDFYCETLTVSQEPSSCWTKQDFHMGNLGKERLRPRFPNFLQMKLKSCWSAQRHLMNKGLFHIHAGNLKWSRSSKIKISVLMNKWHHLLFGHTGFSQWCPNFSQCRLSAFHFGTHKCFFNKCRY